MFDFEIKAPESITTINDLLASCINIGEDTDIDDVLLLLEKKSQVYLLRDNTLAAIVINPVQQSAKQATQKRSRKKKASASKTDAASSAESSTSEAPTASDAWKVRVDTNSQNTENL